MVSLEKTDQLARSELVDPGLRRKSLADWVHVLAFAAISWPWFLLSYFGGTSDKRTALLAHLRLTDDALPRLGGWKVDVGFLNLIADYIFKIKPQTVVEFGAGTSTFVTAQSMKLAGAGRLISFDEHMNFVVSTRTWLNNHGLNAELHQAPLSQVFSDWPARWYDHSPLPERIDMLILDGPPWSVHPFVRGAADSLFDRIPVGGVVLLDDAARPGEPIVAQRWKKRWPDFEFQFVRSGTKGTLVGSRTRDPDRSTD